MAALGRILQVLGWLWLVAGFASRFVDIPNFSVVPGLILIFVARMIRKQAERIEMPELPEGQPQKAPEPASSPERQLNTDRQRTVEQTVIVPEPKPSALAKPRPGPETVEPEDLLERIALAGESNTPSMSARTGEGPETARKPKSSDEMIAEARRRWDSKKR